MRNELIRAVRERAGLFRLPSRGVIEVAGADRVRWLNAMVTCDVEALAPSFVAYGLLLTREGRLVTDFHVLALPDALLLELEREAVGPSLTHLDRYLIADDVELTDRSEAVHRVALEGPLSGEVLAAATGSPLPLADDAWRGVTLAGAAVRVAAFGFSGEPAYQLFVAATAAEGVEEALREAGRDLGVVEADEAILEILRIEAGVPRFGQELDESVLPAEARLERAVSTTKGCYLGQEVVERLRSRGRVGHLLVGLQFEADSPPPADTPLMAETKGVGEVTSSAESPGHGAIGLGFVRREHSEPGTALRAGNTAARVVQLPFFDRGRC